MSCCSESLLTFLVKNPDRVNLRVVPERNFETEIAIATSVVEVEHNMGKFPSPMVFNEFGQYIEIAYRYEGRNKIVFESSLPFKGKIYLS